MSRSIPLALAAALFLPAVACDDPPPAKPAAPSATVVAAPPPVTTPVPTSAPEPPRKRHEGPCSKDANITFTDALLEGKVRFQVQKPTGPISRADLGKVKTLNLSTATTDDELDPCLFPLFTGLKELFLAPGRLDDSTPVKGLTQMESLRISITHVKDLGPLAGLTKLDRLDAGRTPVSDLGPIASCVNLTELQIDDTEVGDLAPLAKMKKLEKLSIKRTKVSDVSPLKEMTKLKDSYIEGSPGQGRQRAPRHPRAQDPRGELVLSVTALGRSPG